MDNSFKHGSSDLVSYVLYFETITLLRFNLKYLIRFLLTLNVPRLTTLHVNMTSRSVGADTLERTLVNLGVRSTGFSGSRLEQ